jgi:hypothetical protein
MSELTPELMVGAAVVAAFLVMWAAHHLARVRRSQRFVDGLQKPRKVHEAGCQDRSAAFEREVRNFRDGGDR